MKTIWFNFLDILLIFLSNNASSKPTPTSYMISNIQACGKSLADLLQDVCSMGYNNFYSKESNGKRNNNKISLHIR